MVKPRTSEVSTATEPSFVESY